MLAHVDLFSGIGGFTLAAHANGLQTVCFCEIDQRCRDFLSKAWPGIDIHDDIRTFDGTKYNGSFLLTAGVPCQPASRAGKQRGKDDVRWLWPEAIRVLGQVKPAWAIFENPPGIGDVGLSGILSDVEAQGYKVTKCGCSVFQLAPSALRTEESDFGLWGAARVSRGQYCSGQDGKKILTMEGQLAHWPTIRASKTTAEEPESWQRRKDAGGVATPPIGMLVKATWPTVRVSTMNGPSKKEIENGNPKMRLETELASNGMISYGCLARTEKFGERLTTLSSWLMGYAAAYLRLWATVSSGRSRRKLSEQ